MVAAIRPLPSVSIRLRAVPEDLEPAADAASIRSRTGSRRRLSPSTRHCVALMRQSRAFILGRKARRESGLMQLMPATGHGGGGRPPDRPRTSWRSSNPVLNLTGPAICHYAAEGSQRRRATSCAGARLTMPGRAISPSFAPARTTSRIRCCSGEHPLGETRQFIERVLTLLAYLPTA